MLEAAPEDSLEGRKREEEKTGEKGKENRREGKMGEKKNGRGVAWERSGCEGGGGCELALASGAVGGAGEGWTRAHPYVRRGLRAAWERGGRECPAGAAGVGAVQQGKEREEGAERRKEKEGAKRSEGERGGRRKERGGEGRAAAGVRRGSSVTRKKGGPGEDRRKEERRGLGETEAGAGARQRRSALDSGKFLSVPITFPYGNDRKEKPFFFFTNCF